MLCCKQYYLYLCAPKSVFPHIGRDGLNYAQICKPETMVADKVNDFIIDLRRMTVDKVSRHYTLDDAFWAASEYEDITGGEVTADVEITTVGDDFRVRFQIEGTVNVPCDRCLDDMPQPIAVDESLMVRLAKQDEEVDENLITINEMRGTLDVSWIMSEMVAVTIPVQHMHEEGACNPEMMERLAAMQVGTFQSDEENTGDTSEDSHQAVDPRWNELKKIIDNN